MTKTCKPEKGRPEGYIQWSTWIEKKVKTHDQFKCEKCGLFHIWVKKSKIPKDVDSMSKIDGAKINKFIEANKSKKPEFCNVDQQEWENALEGYQESLSNCDLDKMTTEEFWTLIYFCAMAFCRGMERAEVKSGLKTESYYPRY